MRFIEDLNNRPIAIDQDKANEQHYEVPTEFIKLCLGPRMKYSSCMYETPKSSLADAEDAILASYCVEAKLGRGLRGVGVEKGKEPETEAGKEGEGLKILDLGCGWGSLGLFLAEVCHGAWTLGCTHLSTTLWQRSLCCPTPRHKRSTSTVLRKRRDLAMSPLLRATLMCMTLRRKRSESTVCYHDALGERERYVEVRRRIRSSPARERAGRMRDPDIS